MTFSTDASEISQWLCQIREFRRLMEESEDFPLDNFYDMREQIAHLRLEGTYLEEEELWNLQRSLSTIHRIIVFLSRDSEEAADGNFTYRYPALQRLTDGVCIFPNIIGRIEQMLDKYGRIKDTASIELARIRYELQKTQGSISRTLNAILNTVKHEGLVDKDVSPTLRDGRLVIPVVPSMKRRIRGIVHDESASGKTVYIEPAEVVETNNRIRELENEERREIIRILKDVASLIRPYIREISESYHLLANIDFIRSKSLLAELLNCYEPEISSEPVVDWIHARHPLLQLSLERYATERVPEDTSPVKKIVPLDIVLTPEKRMLIISGPNAGGKSVCLKTAGLLQYMLQCGLSIPVADRSQVGVFSSIMIDIGDEQSIEQSLSTFSAHISRIIKILSVADSDSLVLLDELGSGTDPLEGAALAEAILEEIKNRGGLFMATTHYPELKTYALQTRGVENACFEFDVKTFCPTYRLLIGVPGSSNAFAISKRLGLPDGIIDSAKANLSGESRRFEEALDAMEKARKKYEKEYAEIAESGAAVKELRVSLEKREAKLLEEEDKKLEEASKRAKYIVDEARVQANRVIDELEELRKQKENEDLKKLLGKAKSISSKDIDKMYAAADPVIERNDKDYSLPRELVVGDKVLIYSMNKKAEVIEKAGKNKKVLVCLGSMNMRVAIDDLRLIEAKEPKKPAFSPTRSVKKNAQRQVSAELDIRGKNAEEAILEIDMFIDHAVLANLNQVTIIHGKGTGVLRKAAQTRLKSHPNVKTYRLGVFGEGEAGVTIAYLK